MARTGNDIRQPTRPKHKQHSQKRARQLITCPEHSLLRNKGLTIKDPLRTKSVLVCAGPERSKPTDMKTEMSERSDTKFGICPKGSRAPPRGPVRDAVGHAIDVTIVEDHPDQCCLAGVRCNVGNRRQSVSNYGSNWKRNMDG